MGDQLGNAGCARGQQHPFGGLRARRPAASNVVMRLDRRAAFDVKCDAQFFRFRRGAIRHNRIDLGS